MDLGTDLLHRPLLRLLVQYLMNDHLHTVACSHLALHSAGLYMNSEVSRMVLKPTPHSTKHLARETLWSLVLPSPRSGLVHKEQATGSAVGY
jgi:hypothetical protein